MRTALITALLLVVPHIIHGAPVYVPNGDSFKTEKALEREDLRRSISEEQYDEQQRYIDRNPSAIPCPSAQTKLDEARSMSQLEPHSTTCPAEGAIQTETPDAFTPNSTVE